jgi:hypothetical protein
VSTKYSRSYSTSMYQLCVCVCVCVKKEWVFNGFMGGLGSFGWKGLVEIVSIVSGRDCEHGEYSEGR